MNSKYQVYGVSFLDLLSGALGAVIILFIIVPKMDVTIPLEELNELRKDNLLLDSLYASIQGNVPEKEFNMLIEISKVQEARIDAINTKHQELQAKYIQAQSKIKNVTKQLQAQKELVKDLRQQIRKIPKPKPTKEKKPTPQKQPVKENKARPEFFAGIDCELAVFIEWENTDHDLDLYFRSGNSGCDDQMKRTKFCNFVKIPRRYKSNPSELIIQPTLVPGTYQIYAHLYRPRSGEAEIDGFIGFSPKEGDMKRIDFNSFKIPASPPPYKDGGGTLLGTLTVTENDIEWNQEI